ncbi:nitroreductase family protein [hydrocarbon metagenome]|uniref:Nitroreductase family protein n=1 Tax=hydrocarbon metagenome TaxID=938273 RepID=A0A0W8E7G8_9ZZZZ
MLDILSRRRSIRKYREDKIEQDKIDQLIKAALLAPTSRNLKPWEFIVVEDKDLLKQLAKCKKHGSAFLEGAALGIVVLADPEKCDVWIEDTSIASIIVHLMAESMGLGSCWIQIRERWYDAGTTAEDYVKDSLKIPHQYKVESIISVGYPAEQKPPRSESELPYGKVHMNAFGG